MTSALRQDEPPLGGETVLRRRRDLAYFLSVVFIYVFAQVGLQPTWLLGQNMWAEAGTNFFPNSQSPQLLTRVFALDSGYFALPPRLIALLGELLQIPLQAIPYFYNWSALVASGLLVGAFCLRSFRIVLESDVLRFLVCLLVLAFLDWGGRTFINFSHYAVFFVLVVGVTLIVQRHSQSDWRIPWYFWIVPLLALAKPSIASAALIYVWVVFFRQGKRRALAVMFLAAVGVQLVRLVVSRLDGVYDQGPFSLKGAAADFLFFSVALPGRLLFGPTLIDGRLVLAFAAGCLFVAGTILALRFLDFGLKTLALASLTLLLSNAVWNSVTKYGGPGSIVNVTDIVPVHTHSHAAYVGALTLLVALVLGLLRTFHQDAPRLMALLLAVWFVVSGWAALLLTESLRPPWPLTGNGLWAQRVASIEVDDSSAYVPIDPIGWAYTKDREVFLYPYPLTAEAQYIKAHEVLVAPVPTEVGGKLLTAISVTVMSESAETYPILVTGTIEDQDGRSHQLRGWTILGPSPSTLLLEMGEPAIVKQENPVVLTSDVDYRVMSQSIGSSPTPVAQWVTLP